TSTLDQHPLVKIRREEFCEIPGAETLTRQLLADGSAGSLPPHGAPSNQAVAALSPAPNPLVLIATGPLTSDALARPLQAGTGSENLAFYDAISPIVDAETLNMDRIFLASRYGKGVEDYLHCQLDQ